MTEPPHNPLILDEETLAFLREPVSMNLATVDDGHRPAVTRLFGCRVGEDRRTLRLFLASRANAAVLDNIRANGTIAVVFSRPSTHRTVQLKGDDARLETIGAEDLPAIRAYRESLTRELGSLGYPVSFAHAMIPAPERLDTAIRFTAVEAYSQTPGPRAGDRL